MTHYEHVRPTFGHSNGDGLGPKSSLYSKSAINPHIRSLGLSGRERAFMAVVHGHRSRT